MALGAAAAQQLAQPFIGCSWIGEEASHIWREFDDHSRREVLVGGRICQALVSVSQRLMNGVAFVLACEFSSSPDEQPCFEVEAVDIEGAEHVDDGSIVDADCVRPKNLSERNRSFHFLQYGRAGSIAEFSTYAGRLTPFTPDFNCGTMAALMQRPLAMEIKVSEHAREAMVRRRLSEADVLAVAHQPEQQIDIRPGRVLAQAIRRLAGHDERVYLLRVVIDLSPDGPEIVTAYKTSRITRYWKGVQ